MEKITSGLPPISLPYHDTAPQNTQTLISPIHPILSFPVYINSQSIRFTVPLLHPYLPSPLSLSILRYLFVISQGFRLYGDRRGLNFSSFQQGILHSDLLHYWASM